MLHSVRQRHPHGWTVKALASVLGVALAFLGPAMPARADDDLDHQKAQVDQQVANAQDEVSVSEQALADANQRVVDAQTKVDSAQAAVDSAQAAVDQAQAAVDQAQAAVDSAQATLRQAQADLAAAQAAEAAAQAAVVAAQAEVTSAQAREDAGEAAIAAQNAQMTAYALSSYQVNKALLGLATIIDSSLPGEIGNRLHWANIILNSDKAQIAQLQALQVELAQDRGDREVAEAKTQAAKDAATRSVAETQAAKDAADQAMAAVTDALNRQKDALAVQQDALAARTEALTTQTAALAEQTTARDESAALVAQAKKEYEDLVAEQNRVNAKIAEAARKAEEARKAAEAAGKPASNAGSSTSSSGLIRPVNGYVSSTYGMRLHPVLHIWRLHDGTDFAAECGAPVWAAASGTVTDEYFNSSYGNRLFIDHGFVNGHHLVTAYNHLSGYAVAVGAHVSQGQTVAYVGSTGLSTGCHLHLNLWVDGSSANPMTMVP